MITLPTALFRPRSSRPRRSPPARAHAAAQLRALWDGVRDAALLPLDAEGRVLDWHRGAEEITGYRAEEIVGQSATRLYARRDVENELLPRALTEARDGGRSEHEGWLVRRDGSRFWANVVVTRISHGVARGSAAFLHAIRDVSDRKAVDEARQKLVALVDGSSDFIAVASLGADLLFVNRSGLRLLGLPREGLPPGVPFFDLFDRASVRTLMTEALPSVLRNADWQGAVDAVHVGTRQTIPLRLSAFVVSDAETEEPLAIALVGRDVSNEVRAERERAALLANEQAARAAAEAAEQRFRALVDGLTDAIVWEADGAGSFTFVSRSAETILGRPPEAWLVDPSLFESAVHPADRDWVTHLRREQWTAGRDHQFECRCVATDGRTVWLRNQAYAVRGPDGAVRGWRGLMTDVTARKKIEDDYANSLFRERVARADAEAANRAKDDFITTVSHDLRSPLNVILGWSRMLRAPALEPAIAARAVDAIERNVTVQKHLIDDLVDVARIVTGEIKLESRPVSLGSVLSAAAGAVRAEADVRGVRLEIESAADLPDVSGDPDRLHQVAWKLLKSAARRSPAGGTVRATLDRAGASLELRVSDEGAALLGDALRDVFDRAGAQPGTGLALVVVRRLVELHGGSVSAENNATGVGVTLRVRIPVATVRDVGHETPARGTTGPHRVLAAGPACLTGLRVLVVEDHPDGRDLLCTVLAGSGATVTAAASAAEALAAIERVRPDVLVSDIELSDEDGYSLIRRVRELEAAHGGKIPAAALTAHARGEDRRRALGAGYQVHVPKPVDPDELVATVASLAAGRTARTSAVPPAA